MGTSRVFPAILALYDRLSEQSWPTDMTGGVAPVVVLGSAPDPAPVVLVRVSAIPTEPVSQEWATNVSRQETFTLLVEIAVLFAHPDERTALLHLWQLCDVVQLALVPEAGPDPLLYGDDITITNSPRTFTPRIRPEFAPVDNGHGARAVIEIPMTFRI